MKQKLIETIKQAIFEKYGRTDGTIDKFAVKKNTGIQANQLESIMDNPKNMGLNTLVKLCEDMGYIVEVNKIIE